MAAPKPTDVSAEPPPLEVGRGEGQLALQIPRDESLEYEVRMGMGWLGSPKVGKVILSSDVQPFRSSALVTHGAAQELGERGRFVAQAKGGNAFYTLEQNMTTLVLPQEWPHLQLSSLQTGSENRRRELQMGEIQGEGRSRYKSDHHCGGCKQLEHFVEGTFPWQSDYHCRKCKSAEHRVWREPRERAAPTQAVDMISAVYLARSMLAKGMPEMTFPLLDNDTLWEVTVRRVEQSTIELESGKFDAVRLDLVTRPAAGEKASPDDFRGLFGIHGKVSIWFEARTGVPVLISGEVPLGPLDLAMQIRLTSWRGTPAAFQPL